MARVKRLALSEIFSKRLKKWFLHREATTPIWKDRDLFHRPPSRSILYIFIFLSIILHVLRRIIFSYISRRLWTVNNEF